MSKVVVYLRVSTENQEAEGTSLETQERACLAKARELAQPGDEVVVLREVYSGLSLERPELSKLRDWVRAGQVRAVVVYAADRLSRDGLHLLLLVEEIEKAGTTLAFVTEPHQSTPEGQLLTFVRGWASKLEALKIKERTARGRKERCREGRLPGKGNLYGYLHIRGRGEGRGIRVPDSEKAPVVSSVFSWYAGEGLSLEGMRKRLYALGTASPDGKAYWSPSTLLRLLRNRAYIGETVARWSVGGKEDIEIPGATPALVDRALFEAAQDRLIHNKEYARRRAKHDFLLRGLVFCDNCGRRMVGASPGGCRSYRCTGHKWNPDRHCGRSVNADNLEAGVWEKVLAILSSPQLVRAQVEQRRGDGRGPELEPQLAKVEAKLHSLSQGEAAIARQLRQGLLSEEVAARELRQGQQERAALERERANLLGQLEGARQWEALDIEALCQQARANLEAPTAEIKRLAFEALQVKVTVRRQEAVVSLALPVQQEPQDSFALRTPRRGGRG
ncbi:MAG: recombinase family protein [Chloroflexota bacterium]